MSITPRFMRKHPCLLVALLSLTLVGCSNGISARISEKSAMYEQLRPEIQQQLRDGIVEPGFTADMVYVALGAPTRTEIRQTPRGPVGFWIYTNLYPEGYVPAEPAAAAKDARSDQKDVTKTPENWAYSGVSVLGPSHGKSYWAFDRKGQKPYQASFSARDPGMEPLDIPDMESAKLYVAFFEGRVVKMSLQRL